MKPINLTFPEGRTKAVTLSYDDGKVSDREMITIMNKYGLKETFNISYGTLGKKGKHLDYLPAEEVGELYQGHEVACHTYDHETLTRLPKHEMIAEILKNREGLEKLVDYPIRGFAYPMGVFNEEIKKILTVCGIEYARTTMHTQRYDLPRDLLEWSATCHHQDGLLEKTDAFLARNRPSVLDLFYVWGHSYEFVENNNWELFTSFCQKVSGKQEIWFATNIEIVDYLAAFQRLIFSADSSFVINPSMTDISLLVDGSRQIIAKAGGKTRLD
ncbi:MAG: polysaccharide deacetylase family protein [Enterococcus gilvus]